MQRETEIEQESLQCEVSKGHSSSALAEHAAAEIALGSCANQAHL
jgi:hypothetical protein